MTSIICDSRLVPLKKGSLRQFTSTVCWRKPRQVSRYGSQKCKCTEQPVLSCESPKGGDGPSLLWRFFCKESTSTFWRFVKDDLGLVHPSIATATACSLCYYLPLCKHEVVQFAHAGVMWAYFRKRMHNLHTVLTRY